MEATVRKARGATKPERLDRGVRPATAVHGGGPTEWHEAVAGCRNTTKGGLRERGMVDSVTTKLWSMEVGMERVLAPHGRMATWLRPIGLR
jgi:hypothetical protein